MLLRPKRLNLPGREGRRCVGVQSVIASLSWMDVQEAGPQWGPSPPALGISVPPQLLVLFLSSFGSHLCVWEAGVGSSEPSFTGGR